MSTRGGARSTKAGDNSKAADDSFEVLTIGRVGVDLYPPGIGLPLSEVHSFDKFLGGSPINVAGAASRYATAVR